MHDLEERAERTPRQHDLIRVATTLFAQRGYHAVGINEISGELGLTGPAFYRHYPSKEALLIDVIDVAITTHLEQVRALVASEPDPRKTLDAIISYHIAFVLDQTDSILIWRTEFRAIPGSDRDRLWYLQRLYIEEWVRIVSQLRPELEVEQLRSMCHIAIALLQAPTEFTSALSRPKLSALLGSMAFQVLLGG